MCCTNNDASVAIAQRTADHLGVRFIGQRLDEAALADNFEATTMMCEHHNPDLNSVGKFILSKLAADHGVKVVLSGTLKREPILSRTNDQ